MWGSGSLLNPIDSCGGRSSTPAAAARCSGACRTSACWRRPARTSRRCRSRACDVSGHRASLPKVRRAAHLDCMKIVLKLRRLTAEFTLEVARRPTALWTPGLELPCLSAGLQAPSQEPCVRHAPRRARPSFQEMRGARFTTYRDGSTAQRGGRRRTFPTSRRRCRVSRRRRRWPRTTSTTCGRTARARGPKAARGATCRSATRSSASSSARCLACSIFARTCQALERVFHAWCCSSACPRPYRSEPSQAKLRLTHCATRLVSLIAEAWKDVMIDLAGMPAPRQEAKPGERGPVTGQASTLEAIDKPKRIDTKCPASNPADTPAPAHRRQIGRARRGCGTSIYLERSN